MSILARNSTPATLIRQFWQLYSLQLDFKKCQFTLKRVGDMIRTYSQKHRSDKYSQHSSIIWPIWLNG